MKKGLYRRFITEKRGASMVEFTLIAPFLFLLTFGIAEFGYIFYQFQSLDAATSIAARMAATRGPVITGVADCGVTTTATPGTPCSHVAGSKTWTPISCDGNSPAGNCDVTLMNRIVTEMQTVYPQMTLANLVITYGPSGHGFVGLGKPVPTVTVTVSGVSADFIALGAFGLNNIVMPPFTTSLTGEDLSGT